MIAIRVCEECVRMCKDQATGVVDLPATPSYLIGLSVHIFAGFTGLILQSLLMLADGYDYIHTTLFKKFTYQQGYSHSC